MNNPLLLNLILIYHFNIIPCCLSAQGPQSYLSNIISSKNLLSILPLFPPILRRLTFWHEHLGQDALPDVANGLVGLEPWTKLV